VSEKFNIDTIQGNILRGYHRELVRYLILEVADRGAARRFLAASVAGDDADVPAITRATPWTEKPTTCFNIGVTYEGLGALGTSEEHLATFPTEFIQGMTKRALKLGDFGESAPENWPAPFDQPERVHIIASIYADATELLDEVQAQVEKAFNVIGVRDGRDLAKDKVFFGYVDSISQPRFEGISDPEQAKVDEPIDPLGTVLLGYRTRLENLFFRKPSPEELGLNGSFNAFRVLAQDAAGFETYLDRAAEVLLAHPDVDKLLAPGDEELIGEGLDRRGALREIVAAQMLGRWRNGVPYETSPNAQWPDPAVSLTNFDYYRASRCPAGAHLRRVNPRGGPIVQRIANYTRRLVRRGMSYGPDFDPSNPDSQERGLLGNFIGANLGAQFEAVMCDWLNLGLQDPDITGSNDPLIGANTQETSWFDLSLKNGGAIRLRGFPRFVTTRGGAYTFLPSLLAIQYLSGLTD
jgi:deferrochelatase/peroxidase EfeB